MYTGYTFYSLSYYTEPKQPAMQTALHQIKSESESSYAQPATESIDTASHIDLNRFIIAIPAITEFVSTWHLRSSNEFTAANDQFDQSDCGQFDRSAHFTQSEKETSAVTAATAATSVGGRTGRTGGASAGGGV